MTPAAGATAVAVEMVDIDVNPNEFAIPARSDVTVTAPADGYSSCNVLRHEAAGMFGTMYIE